MQRFFISFVPFFLINLFFVFGAQAQEKDTQLSDSTQVVSKAIAISDISDETEKVHQHINKLKKILKPSTQIQEVDSLINDTSIVIKSEKDSLDTLLDTMTSRELKVEKVEWNSYHSQLKSYQNVLNNRIEDITDISDDVIDEIKKWEETKDQLVDNSKSDEIYEGLDEVIGTLQDIMNTAHKRLDSVYLVQKSLTELVLIVDEAISEIEFDKHQLQLNYFVIDSKPLWKSENKAIDTTKTNSLSVTKLISTGLNENYKLLKDFLSINIKTLIFQIVFILILFILILFTGKKWKKNITEITNPLEEQTEIILSHSIASTLVVGLLISVFFYTALIPIYSEIVILLILISTIILLPKLTVKRFRVFLIIIFLVYFFHIFEAYLDTKVELLRWLNIIDALVLIIALSIGKRIMKKSPDQFEPIYKLFLVTATIYIVLLATAILVNIIGMVSLSKFLVSGILTSTVLAMVVYLNIKVISVLFLLFFQLKKSHEFGSISDMINSINQRVEPILAWIGLIIWLIFTLMGFGIFDLVISWIDNLMLVEWDIGEMTISLGGILSFLGVFTVTLILSKISSIIFQDVWVIKTLPRGAAPAISLVLRIIIVGAGLYIAFSAAGIDLSNLGFIIGALGVGIGFGLQNIVLNFISGLILAFERPVNLGDTIRVDDEFGVVTGIGVRSSHIKSYSGYEAIIPNGDLISKKVINYTLSNRNRRSKIYMKTAPNADPEKVIELFNEMAAEDSRTLKEPVPKTYFYGYDPEGNLSFALLYWTTFSDTLKTESSIALKIFSKLKEEGIQAPAPIRRIIND